MKKNISIILALIVIAVVLFMFWFLYVYNKNIETNDILDKSLDYYIATKQVDICFDDTDCIIVKDYYYCGDCLSLKAINKKYLPLYKERGVIEEPWKEMCATLWCGSEDPEDFHSICKLADDSVLRCQKKGGYFYK